MIVNARTVDEVLARLSIMVPELGVMDAKYLEETDELIRRLWDRVQELEGVTGEVPKLTSGRVIGPMAKSQVEGLRV